MKTQFFEPALSSESIPIKPKQLIISISQGSEPKEQEDSEENEDPDRYVRPSPVHKRRGRKRDNDDEFIAKT